MFVLIANINNNKIDSSEFMPHLFVVKLVVVEGYANTTPLLSLSLLQILIITRNSCGILVNHVVVERCTDVTLVLIVRCLYRMNMLSRLRPQFNAN